MTQAMLTRWSTRPNTEMQRPAASFMKTPARKVKEKMVQTQVVMKPQPNQNLMIEL